MYPGIPATCGGQNIGAAAVDLINRELSLNVLVMPTSLSLPCHGRSAGLWRGWIANESNFVRYLLNNRFDIDAFTSLSLSACRCACHHKSTWQRKACIKPAR
jgi:hypothetical protein